MRKIVPFVVLIAVLFSLSIPAQAASPVPEAYYNYLCRVDGTLPTGGDFVAPPNMPKDAVYSGTLNGINTPPRWYSNTTGLWYTGIKGTPSTAIDEPNKYYICNFVEYHKGNLTFEQVIANIIYGEGGGSNSQISADILQVLTNQMKGSWLCNQRPLVLDKDNGKYNSACFGAWKEVNKDKSPWSAITKDDFKNLALYLISAPYTSPSGETQYPAWNTWSDPFPMGIIFNSYPIYLANYNKILDMVTGWENSLGDSISYAQDTYYSSRWEKVVPAHAVTPSLILVQKPNIIFFFSSMGPNSYLRGHASYTEVTENNEYIYFSTFPYQGQ